MANQGNSGNQQGGGFNIPPTLAPGLPTFWNNDIPGVKSFLGQPYHGDPSGHFKQLSFNALNNLAIQSALQSQQAAQSAWEQRYPLLAKADKLGITSSLMNISGKHDPMIYGALKDAGLGPDASGMGGIDLGSNAFDQARNMGSKDLLSKDMRDRNYAANVFNNHPITKLGLGPADVYRIAEANTGGLNAFSSNAAENAVNLANSQAAANQQIGASILGGISQIAGTGIRAYGQSQSPQLTPSYYNSQYIYSTPGADLTGAGG